MKSILAGVGLFFLTCGPVLAQSAVTAKDCAAVYGAFAQEQTAFGNSGGLIAERYLNFAKIDFNDRLAQLAGKSEIGITELKSSAEAAANADYAKLVDAETEGDVDTPDILTMTRLSDSCDEEFGFAPSLGG